MASDLKILWVQDDINGPLNGIAEYKNEQLWFSKLETVPDINTPVPNIKKEELIEKDDSDDDWNWEHPVDDEVKSEEALFSLYRLAPDVLSKVTENHIQYCAKTGAPLFHGQPHKPIVQKVQTIKATPQELSAALPEGATHIEVAPNLMVKVNQYHHMIDPKQISGDYVCTVKQSEFTNYYVPHKIQM